jgi:hypothetical protein
MIGASVFLGQQLEHEQEAYLDIISNLGGTTIFTSLHIPEDDSTLYKKALQTLGSQVQSRNMKLYVDMSTHSMTSLGLQWEDSRTLVDWGITGIRMDYGIESAVIADISKCMPVALNASTLTPEWLEELLALGLVKNHAEVWHNYYPRPETALDATWFDKQNRWFKEQGLKTVAFIPGDGQLRGPLYKGLPTLEDHRFLSPLASYLSFVNDHPVDEILIGDPSLSLSSVNQFKAYQTNEIPLRYQSLIEDSQTDSLLNLNHRNRFDPARDVIRSEGARPFAQTFGEPLRARNQIARAKGAITIDNELYGRYQGDLHIVKNPLAENEAVNVVGQVIKEDLPLLEFIGAGQCFSLIRVEL